MQAAEPGAAAAAAAAVEAAAAKQALCPTNSIFYTVYILISILKL